MILNTHPENRKAMVKVICELTGMNATYLFTPTYAYQVGPITVRRDGSIDCEDEAIMEAPDGVLLVTDLGLDRIVAYDAELNRTVETALRPGSGPRHLAFSTDGETVFCANELSSTVCMYRYDGAGRMTLLDEQSTLPMGYTQESTVAAIRADGDRVYASNRGHDSIACLRAEGDALILEGFFPCHGTGPRDFDIVGDKIVCTNETSELVTVLDKQTGKLLSALCLPRPLCVTVLPPEKR